MEMEFHQQHERRIRSAESVSGPTKGLAPAPSTTTRRNGCSGQERHPDPGAHGGLRVSLQLRRRLTSDAGPERREVTFSFLPLSDAAPIIVAHAKGWFEEQGIRASLRRETSWTALRDSLNLGVSHAAQMLFVMPLAANCGLLGGDQQPLIVPWVLNSNGQAITLNTRYQGRIRGDARVLRDEALAGREAGRPLVFGHTLRIGTHAMWLRYWLAAGGIDPIQDVVLITVPPSQMVRNMRGAAMTGFCVGEPWNAHAIVEGVGYTAVASQQLWPDHPEKVCAFTEAFAEAHPRTVIAILKALDRSSRWLDDASNHDEAAALLARPDYLNCDETLVRGRLGRCIDFGDDRVEELSCGLRFFEGRMNRPCTNHALWFLTQLRRWGLHFGEPPYQEICRQVIRPEFHDQALEELGRTALETAERWKPRMDGIALDPTDPEAYARSFRIHNLQG